MHATHHVYKITDAQIINDTNCDSTATTNPTAAIIQQNENEQNNSDCNTISDSQKPNSNLITLQISFNQTTQGQTKAPEGDIPNCDKDPKAATDVCLEQLAVTNEIPNSDSVLKYVYKADDKSFIKEKSKPHPLNSLRKKRSVDSDNKIENVSADESKTAPLIVDYETRHSQQNSEESPLAGKSVQNAALADFKIETLHDSKKPVTDKEISNESSSQSREESTEKINNDKSNSEESLERSSESKKPQIENDKYSKNEKSPNYNEDEKYVPSESRENYDSREKEPDSRERYPAHNSRPSKEKLRRQGSFEQYEEKDNRGPYEPRQGTSHSTRRNSDESNESGERDSREYSKPSGKIKNNRGNINYESGEKDSREYKKPRGDLKNNQRSPDYESSENDSREYKKPRGELKQNQRSSDYESGENDSREYRKPRGELKQNQKSSEYESGEKDSREYRKPRGELKQIQQSSEYESGEKDSREYKKPYGEIKNNRDNAKYPEDDKSTYKDNSENSKQKEFNDNEKSKYSEESGEISSERKSQPNFKPTHEKSSGSEEDTPSRSRVYDSKSPEKLTNRTHNPSAIQDVDLGDFSFERIQVDDKGKVVPAGENDETSHSTKPLKSGSRSSEKLSSSEESAEPINEKYENHKEPVHINDGEIKPVVEINSDSNEAVPENISGALKTNSEKDDSLESLLGTKEDFEQKNGELTSDKDQNEKADVKQEFERIPVDYKHKNENDDLTDQKETNNNDKIKSETTPTEAQPNEEPLDLDALKPISVRLDEHLKFKFDDVGIKLPEIKIPDVLDFDYEEPSYLKRNENQKESEAYHHYNDEEPKKKKKSDDNADEHDDANYYGYYGNEGEKQNYKKKNENGQDDNEDQEDEQDHEDLYERFVRERFGKRGSFQERSGQLRDAPVPVPHDPKLYDTVKNILKKTENIQKQAQKSGDPNAGYAWTLEYGENL